MRLAALLAVLVAACSPYSPKLPDEPFLCGSSDECPDNYTCQTTGTQKICVETGGGGSDTIDAPGSSGGSCSDDSKLEPNNTLAQAFQTTVDGSSRKSIDLADLAICPTGDIDIYEFSIATMSQGAVATVIYDASGAPLQMDILNSNGPIVNAAAVSGTPDTITATTGMVLAVGNYYVQVNAPTSGGTNPNYELKLTISGP